MPLTVTRFSLRCPKAAVHRAWGPRDRHLTRSTQGLRREPSAVPSIVASRASPFWEARSGKAVSLIRCFRLMGGRSHSKEPDRIAEAIRSRYSLGIGRLSPLACAWSAVLTNAVLSLDDRWVAYDFLEPQLGPSVYVQPFPPTGAKRLVSKEALAPMWSPDGQEIFVGGQLGVLRVQRVMTTQPSFTLGNPTEQTRPGFIARLDARNFDIMPDGRIIGVVNAGETPSSARVSPQIQVVLNWLEELKQRVPTR